MDKAGIITVVSQHKTAIDKLREEGKEPYLSKFAQQLLEKTQAALEEGKSL